MSSSAECEKSLVMKRCGITGGKCMAKRETFWHHTREIVSDTLDHQILFSKVEHYGIRDVAFVD